MSVHELVVLTGSGEGEVYRLEEDEVIIGRDSSCGICLEDPMISRRHGKITRRPDGLVVEDLGSANGTLVNGVRVTSSALKENDRLRVGKIELLLRRGIPVSPRATDSPARRTPGVQPGRQQEPTSAYLLAGEKSETASIMSITQSLNAGELMNLLGRSHATLKAMYQINRLVSSIFDLDMLLDRILEETFSIIRAERAFVLLLDPATNRMEVRASRWQDKEGLDQNVSISQHIISHVLERKESVLLADAMADSQFGLARSVVLHKIRSAMCAPLRGRSQIVGIIHVDTSTGTGEFNHDDLMLLDAIGNAAGIAVENAQLYREKLQNERLAAMGQAIAGLSHYIKNILAAMETSYTLVERGLEAEDLSVISRVWKILRRSNERISDLVLDMLAYSKERKPDPQPCMVNDVCKEVAALLADRLHAAKAELHLDLDPELPFIQADPQGMHRCLLNLVGNACDALEQGEGRVTLRTRKVGEAEIGITVEDTGAGIPEDICERIFEVFFSTKGSRGTGLGLAVTRKIVQEHGGSVEVDSEPGRGTVFTVRLPVGGS
jgi:signal transduction histidine kinase/pSer/pThr/pTyr-binding forkhead associated (FHA) protein